MFKKYQFLFQFLIFDLPVTFFSNEQPCFEPLYAGSQYHVPFVQPMFVEVDQLHILGTFHATKPIIVMRS